MVRTCKRKLLEGFISTMFFGRTNQGIAESLYLTHLMVRGLRDDAPDDLPQGVTWERIFELSGQNCVDGLTWHSVRFASGLSSDLVNKWGKRARETAHRRIRFDAERDLLIASLASAGLSSMPLKGAAFAHLYPGLDMRAMGDNDILYGLIEQDESGAWRVGGDSFAQRFELMCAARDKLVEVMEGLGYTAHVNGPMTDCHDYKFTKPPLLVFEMHHAITNKWMSEDTPFANPWAGARFAGTRSTPGDGLVMEMEKEAEYAYFVYHALKHLVFGGIGIRILADIRVMLDAWETNMDWNRVERYLAPCGALGFEADLRGLCNRAFSETLEPSDYRWIAQMVGERVYGPPVNKSYANHVRALARRLGLKGPENLPGHPMTYIGMGRVSRPLMPIFSIAWRGVQAVRALMPSRV